MSHQHPGAGIGNLSGAMASSGVYQRSQRCLWAHVLGYRVDAVHSRTYRRVVQPRIFVNYRTGDETFAAIFLDEKLVQRFGPDNVFRCGRSIPLGEDFADRLWASLAQATVMLTIIGPRWLTVERGGVRRLDAPDDFVRREIALALNRRLRVIPVLIADTPLPSAHELPEEIKDLAHRQYLRLYPRSAHRDLRILADELAPLVGESALSPTAEPLRVAHCECDDEHTMRRARRPFVGVSVGLTA